MPARLVDELLAEAERLWGWFKEESLKEFSKIYDLLEVDFDSYAGEAFYNDKMAATIGAPSVSFPMAGETAARFPPALSSTR